MKWNEFGIADDMKQYAHSITVKWTMFTYISSFQFQLPQNVNSEHQEKDDKNVMSPTFCNWKWDFTWPKHGETKQNEKKTRGKQSY